MNISRDQYVGNKAKGRISKRVFQESKARQIFWKNVRVRIRGLEMFVFSENLTYFFSWSTRFKFRPFALSPTNSLQFYAVCFHCMIGWGLSECIETKLQTTCFYLTAFSPLFFKKRSGTSLSVSFSAWLLKKSVSIVIFYYLTKFHFLIAFTSWDIG